MKNVFLLLISFIFFSFTGGKNKNDLENQHLKGNVKQVKEMVYYTEEKNGEFQQNSIENINILNFDAYGNELAAYGSYSIFDTVTRNIFSYQYDANGRIEKKISDYDGLSERGISKFVYDSAGYLTKQIFHYKIDTSQVMIYSFRYDSKGNIIQKKFNTDKDTAVGENYHYKYDEQNNLTEVNWCWLEFPTIIYKSKYYYNEKGDEITYIATHDKIDDIHSYLYLAFDSYGNWTKRVEYWDNRLHYMSIREIKYY